MNVAAFRWGRRAAHDPAVVAQLAQGTKAERRPAQTLDEVIARRAAFLKAYQNAPTRAATPIVLPRCARPSTVSCQAPRALTEAVARNLFKFMAVKDEYEVARLYTDGSFKRQLAEEFQGYDRLEFHLAPPILGRRDADGRPRKSGFSRGMMMGFRALATLKGLRGTAFDPFSYMAERRMERDLLKRYEADLDVILATLSPATLEAAVGARIAAAADTRLRPREAGEHREGGRRTRASACRLAQPSAEPLVSAAE